MMDVTARMMMMMRMHYENGSEVRAAQRSVCVGECFSWRFPQRKWFAIVELELIGGWRLWLPTSLTAYMSICSCGAGASYMCVWSVLYPQGMPCMMAASDGLFLLGLDNVELGHSDDFHGV